MTSVGKVHGTLSADLKDLPDGFGHVPSGPGPVRNRLQITRPQ